MDALRSSPMSSSEQEATDDGVGDAAAADGGGAGGAAACGGAGGAAADGEEDRCDRDTRLSRASNPRIARPRLRNS